MIDSHCHLNFKAFKNDWHEVAQRALHANVEKIINIGSNLETSHRAIEISQEMPDNLYAAIALHPIHVDGEKFSARGGPALGWDISAFEKIITPEVVAIGETGIDLYHSPDSLEAQRKVFIEFIGLANKYHLPVIIHNRGAGVEVLDVLSDNHPQYGGVMHFFSEDWQYAQKLFDLGIIISFTGAITLDNIARQTIEVIEKAPLGKIMVETDSPYVVPEPMKTNGEKRNEPANVIEVVKRIAEIKKVDVSEVVSQTTQNAIDLFRL